MKEHLYDKQLNIKTGGDQMAPTKSFHYHRYEPTPYQALETLFEQYKLKSSDRVVDFGCGKGRLLFYTHHLFHPTVIGIEMNEVLYHEAIANREYYLQKAKLRTEKIQFQCCFAEEYLINPLDNCFYFFNPFTIQIFIKIVNNILVSAEKSSREIDLVLYYPSENYIYYLDNQTPFELQEEIILPDFYQNNPNERFLIYRLKEN
ncbi:SAM-dependent methyltransferase [Neobacillus niacini]|uniref:class I SAM-dependent methyltransferase n=1 Tax=Neobacillus niacini TaxID=86668 RepID=UPI00285C14F4|nr:SAM-dependent methyltransferase [Neobacillus niacini]MDR6999053.1 SAM-dependent methyltransferase [Neobacillus niacini]